MNIKFNTMRTLVLDFYKVGMTKEERRACVKEFFNKKVMY